MKTPFPKPKPTFEQQIGKQVSNMGLSKTKAFWEGVGDSTFSGMIGRTLRVSAPVALKVLSSSKFTSPSPPPRKRAVSLEPLKKQVGKESARRRGYASTVMTRGARLGMARTDKKKVLGA